MPQLKSTAPTSNLPNRTWNGVEYRFATQAQRAASAETGVSMRAITGRIHKGWSLERAVTQPYTPIANSRSAVVREALSVAPRELELTVPAVVARVATLGWDMERAIRTPVNPRIPGVIYKLTDKVTAKVYIGRTALGGLDARLLAHVSNALIRKSNPGTLEYILKHKGIEAFEVEILEEHAIDSMSAQREYIVQYDSFHSGLNMTPGGAKGKVGKPVTFRGVTYPSLAELVVRCCTPGAVVRLARVRKALNGKSLSEGATTDALIAEALELVGGTSDTLDLAKANRDRHGGQAFEGDATLARKLKALRGIATGEDRQRLVNLGMFRPRGLLSWHEGLAEFARTRDLSTPWACGMRLALEEAETLAANPPTTNRARRRALRSRAKFTVFNWNGARLLDTVPGRRHGTYLFEGAELWLQEAGFPLKKVMTESDLQAHRICQALELNTMFQLPLRTVLRVLSGRREACGSVKEVQALDKALATQAVVWLASSRRYISRAIHRQLSVAP